MALVSIIDIKLNSKQLKELVFRRIGEDKDKEFIYVSTTTKTKILSYAKDESNSVTIAKDLWRELLKDSICILKMNDKRERLYSDAKELHIRDKEHDGFISNFDKIRELSSFGIETLGKYFDDFVEYESVLYGTDNYYRDHVNHLLQVWGIGIWLLFQNKQYEKLSFPDNITLLKENNFLFLSEDQNTQMISISEIWAMWTVIALCHDLGYPIEKTSKINQIARKIINHFGCLNFEELNFSFGIFNSFLVEKFLNIISSKINLDHTIIQSKYRDKLTKSIEEFQHGVFSSLLIFKNLTYFLETDYSYEQNRLEPEDLRQFHIRKEILRAIAGHTCPKLYHINLNTISFLLILCDEIQEWDRPYFDDLRVGVPSDKIDVSINECTFDNQLQKIRIEFEFKDNKVNIGKLKEYVINNRFQQMHYFLRSGKDDKQRQIFFLWTVTFPDKTLFEFKFDTSKDSFNMTTIEEYEIINDNERKHMKKIDLFNYKSKNDSSKNPQNK